MKLTGERPPQAAPSVLKPAGRVSGFSLQGKRNGLVRRRCEWPLYDVQCGVSNPPQSPHNAGQPVAPKTISDRQLGGLA